MAEKEGVVDLYGASYGGFASDLYGQIRREAWGEEIGQNSWLTRAELERFISHLQVGDSSRVLEVACGSGGPALHLARLTGCEIVGVDLHDDAVANASRSARAAGLDPRASFVRADAGETMPFEERIFRGAVVHRCGQPSARPSAGVRRLGASARSGRTAAVHRPDHALGSDEIAIRASIAYFLFVPPGEDERLLGEAGLRVLSVEDATENMATVAGRWRAARAKRGAALREIEGDETFHGQQQFLEVAARLARERRLSRFVYLAEKPS